MVIINKEVIQSYLMTTARYDFSVDEKRVLTRLVEMFQPMLEGKKLVGKIEQDLFQTWHLTIPIKQFIGGNDNYQRVRNAIFALNDKKFIYTDDEVEEVIRIVEMPKIYKRGIIQFCLNPKIVQCFLNMSKGFSKYELEVSLSFKSVYSMRLYELLAGQLHALTYNIETLKQMFQVEDKYVRNSDFVNRVILVAKMELDKKSPITFTYRINKRGRRWHSITFQVHKQPQFQDGEIELSKLKRRVDPSLLLGREIYRYLISTCGFENRELKNNLALFGKAMDLFGEEELLNSIRKIQFRARKASNPKGYIINALKSMTDII